MSKRSRSSLGSTPITCWSVMHWALTPRGMPCPQGKKTTGTFRPLEHGYKGTSRYIQHRKRQGSRGLVTPGRKKGSRNQDLKRIRGAAQRGEVLIGSVKSVQSYGACIGLGSLDGLVHLSEVSDDWVGDLTKRLRTGMAVRVIVLQVDGDGKRIALSMRKVP